MSILKSVLAFLRGLIAKEPAVVVSTVVAGVIALAGAFGVVLDVQSVTTVVAEVVAILVGGVAVRSQVTPK